MSKQAALHQIDTFMAGRPHGVWSHVRPDRLAEGLRARVENPNVIDQESYNVCGPASFMREYASADPVGYVNLATKLFSEGWANLGRAPHFGKRLVATSQLRAYNFGHTMNEADWVTLLPLRDSYNAIIHGAYDSGLFGFTLPTEMIKFYKDAGYRHIAWDWSLYLCRGEETARKAGQYFRAGWQVSLLINADVLSTRNAADHDNFFSRVFSVPNHWVDLISNFRGDLGHDDASLSFDVFTWGQDRRVPQSGTLKTKSFYHNFYGYVAGKY